MRFRLHRVRFVDGSLLQFSLCYYCRLLHRISFDAIYRRCRVESHRCSGNSTVAICCACCRSSCGATTCLQVAFQNRQRSAQVGGARGRYLLPSNRCLLMTEVVEVAAAQLFSLIRCSSCGGSPKSCLLRMDVDVQYGVSCLIDDVHDPKQLSTMPYPTTFVVVG